MQITEALDRCPTDLLVDGAWRPAADGRRIEVRDPATTEVLASVASGQESDAPAAVEAAERALPRWAAIPPRERSAVLRRAYELMTERAEYFAVRRGTTRPPWPPAR